ncbi:MAG: hypothetical protein ACRETH_10030 [Steroidobacteraceae bacterium]
MASQHRRPGAISPSLKNRDLAVYAYAHLLADLSQGMLRGGSPGLYREMRARARDLVGLLEEPLKGPRPRGRNIVDLVRHRRVREVLAALDASAPDAPPPRRA